jgi:hypothetical protein
MSAPDNSRPRRAAGTPLIREPSYKVGSGSVSLFLLIPAVVMSTLINGGLILALMLLDSPASRPASASAAPPLEDTKTEAVVQAPDPPPPPEP